MSLVAGNNAYLQSQLSVIVYVLCSITSTNWGGGEVKKNSESQISSLGRVGGAFGGGKSDTNI